VTSLSQTITDYLNGFKQRVDPSVQATMQDATDQLAASGIVNKALGTGQCVPEFSLTDQHGIMRHSQQLLSKPLVISFYRGATSAIGRHPCTGGRLDRNFP